MWICEIKTVSWRSKVDFPKTVTELIFVVLKTYLEKNIFINYSKVNNTNVIEWCKRILTRIPHVSWVVDVLMLQMESPPYVLLLLLLPESPPVCSSWQQVLALLGPGLLL